MKKGFALTILFLLLVSGGGYYYWDNYVNVEEGGEAHAMAGAMVSSVSVLEMQTQKINVTRSLPGRVSALRQSQVRPQVNGIITERLFEEGVYVEKGQQLYQIDDARYKAALTSAEADLKSAKSNIASINARASRYKKLVKIDAVSRQEYDDVKAQLDQANAEVAVAEAAVAVAQVNLDYTKVYAPISGRIGRSLVTEGALVTANQTSSMAVITQLDPVYVDMQLASAEVVVIQQAIKNQADSLPVTLLLGENNQMVYPLKGSLKFSEVTIDETTGSVTLRAVVPNPEGVLLPGLFVRASLELGEENALLIPQRATTRNPDGSLSVWVVSNGKASPASIQVSRAYQDSWIVTEGIKPGDQVIIEGYQKIRPGADVQTSPWQVAEQNSVN